jgi:hypothetical protein
VHLFFLNFRDLKSAIENPKSPNDPIRPNQHVRRNRQSDQLSRLEIDEELKFHRLLHGQIRGLGSLQDLVHVPYLASRLARSPYLAIPTKKFWIRADLNPIFSIQTFAPIIAFLSVLPAQPAEPV